MENTSCILDYIIDGKLCYSLYHENKKVGVFYLVFYPTNIYIDWIHLDEEFRGKGLGNIAVKFILNFCKQFSCLFKLVWLMVDFDNEIAQHLYRKYGFSFDNYIGSYCYRMVCYF